jgi:hypothetical protein
VGGNCFVREQHALGGNDHMTFILYKWRPSNACSARRSPEAGGFGDGYYLKSTKEAYTRKKCREMARYPIESIKSKFLNLILSSYVPYSLAFYWSDSKKGNLKAKQRPRGLPRSCAIVADGPGRCLPNISGIASFPETLTVAPASVLVSIIVVIRGRYRWAI